MIKKFQHFAWAVKDVKKAAEDIEKLFGLKAVDYREPADNVKDMRVLFPNECWLRLIEDNNKGSETNNFLSEKGENLYYLALLSDNLKEDVERLKKAGLDFGEKDIEDTEDGLTVNVKAEDAIGFPVKIIQPHKNSITFEPEKCSNPNILGLQHVGVAIKDVKYASSRFAQLFGLESKELRSDQHYGTQKDDMIDAGNDRLWLHLVETEDPENRVFQFRQKHGEGLEHLCIEFDDIRKGIKRVQSTGTPLFQHKIYLDREDGFEAFVYPEYNHGVTVELIEPYENSRGYRPRPR